MKGGGLGGAGAPPVRPLWGCTPDAKQSRTPDAEESRTPDAKQSCW